MSLNIYLLLSRSHSPPSDRDFGPRSDISNDSIEKNGDPAARFEHQQRRWLAELKARNAKIVQVTYPRTANNDKELTVVRGEYLEVLRAIRWHIGCCRNRPIGSCLGVGQQPQVVEGPEHARRNGARAAHDRDAAGAGRRRFHSAFLCRLAQRQERWFALFLKRQIPPKKRKRKKGDRSCRSPWKKKEIIRLVLGFLCIIISSSDSFLFFLYILARPSLSFSCVCVCLCLRALSVVVKPPLLSLFLRSEYYRHGSVPPCPIMADDQWRSVCRDRHPSPNVDYVHALLLTLKKENRATILMRHVTNTTSEVKICYKSHPSSQWSEF